MSVFDEDVVIGTFTHRTTYLPTLLDSAHKFIPHIPFLIHLQEGKINSNMEGLRQKFMKTQYRYWCFLDDDIQFMNKDIINDAIRDMVANRWACVTVYSTFNPNWKYDPTGLVAREIKWATGYFILVDSFLVGDIQPDLNLPYPNTGADTSYSVAIRARGFNIGISPSVVYHVRKEVPTVSFDDPRVAEVANAYFMAKWGKFYFDVAQYDGNVLEWPIGSVIL